MAGFLAIPQIASQLGGSALGIGTAAAGAAGAGAAAAGAGAAGAGAGFLKALVSSPKGVAALGQGVSALGQAAGLMIGGEKGRKIAQQGSMFQLISGLAPEGELLANIFKKPEAGTANATENAFKGLLEGYTPEKLINPGQTNLGYMGILGNTFA